MGPTNSRVSGREYVTYMARLHGQVPRLVARLQRMRRATVRARDEVQLTGGCARRVELDPDRDAGAQDRVPAEPAVAMPREVGESSSDLGVLDDHALTVDPVDLGLE